MVNFPTLSDQPDVETWEEQRAFDPTIRAKTEAGYTKTRPRTTRIPMSWKLRYSFLTSADKSALQQFEGTVRVGAEAFSWTNPADNQAKTVRFSEPVKYSPVQSKNLWRAEMVIEEV